jgi:hypothetical protein
VTMLSIFSKASKKRDAAQWSKYSQRSVLRQGELEAQIKRCEEIIAYTDKKLAEAEQLREFQVSMVVEGQIWGDYVLPQAISKSSELAESVRLYKERLAALKAELEALKQPSRESIETRTAAQAKIAEAVAARFEKDCEIEACIGRLRQLLDERKALGAEITASARTADLALEEDGLDEQRFEALRAALPTDMVSKSEFWLHHFLGRPEETKPFVVLADVLVLPETLKYAYVFRKSEEASLTPQQAAKPLEKTLVAVCSE